MSQRKRLPREWAPREWAPGYEFEHEHRTFQVWDRAPRRVNDGLSVWAIPLNPRPWDAPVYLFSKGGRHARTPSLLPYTPDGLPFSTTRGA